MRLPNGYGGIVKLSGKRRKPYAVRITTEYTDNGGQKYKYLDYFATRREALACLEEYNKNPYNVDDRKILFSDLYKKWGEWRYKGEEIINTYKSAYKWSEPLHNRVFVDLRADDIQDVIDKCEKGYSTKKNIRILCSLMYQYAIRNEIATVNYAKMTKLPPEEESRIHTPFSDKEIETLWKHTDDPGVCIALILIYTGMRPTELAKIRTENVNIEERYLMGGIKTKSGKNRLIPIAEKIVPLITKLYNPESEYLVMDPDDGKPVRNYDRLRDHFWQRSEVLKPMNHLLHDGRHTCATRLDNAEVNDKVVKLILGHKSKDVTKRVYTHKTKQQLIEAINCI